MTTHFSRRAATAAGLLAAVFWTALPASAVAADDVELSAEANPSVVSVGGSLKYELTVRVNGNRPIKIPGNPDFGGAFRVHGRSSAPQLVVRNGKVRRSRTLTFRLRARTPGTHEIRAPRVRVGTSMHQPDPVEVKVVSGDKPTTPPDRDDSSVRGDGPIRVDYDLKPGRRPYVGQQITLTYRFLLDPQEISARPRAPNEPGLDNFWIEDLSRNLAGQSHMTYVDGRYMKSTVVRSYALFPLESGATTIDPFELEVRVGGFFSQSSKRTLSTDAIKLKVRSLPSGAPVNFYEGNVGSWSFRVRSNAEKVRAGEPMTLRMIADGSGNVGRLQLPKLESSDDFEVTDREEETEKEIQGTQITGRKIVTYTIVPRREGRLEIPPLSFSYFDPNNESYETVESDPIDVSVREGKASSGVASSSRNAVAKSGERKNTEQRDPREQLLGEMAGPIRRPEEVSGRITRTERYGFLIGGGVPLAGLALLIVAPAVSRRLSRSDDTSNDGSAADGAHAILEQAVADSEDAPALVHRAIRDYLHAAFDVPPGDVTSADLGEHLEACGVDADLLEEIVDLLSWCEKHRFSPMVEVDEERLDRAADAAAQLIDELEQQRRNGRLHALSNAAIALLATGVVTVGAVAPLTIAAAPPDDDSAFDEAVKLQDAGKWQKAVDRWRAIAESGGLSAAGRYNLGTALAHLGELGPSRLRLERAARTAPGHPKLRNNVQKVRELVGLKRLDTAKRTTLPTSAEPGLEWWKLATSVGTRPLALACLLAIWVAFLGMLGRRRWEGSGYRAAATTALTLGLLGGIAAAALWGARTRTMHVVQPAVVTAPDTVDVYAGPSSHASLEDPEFPLVAGTMLRVERRRDDWWRVRTGVDASGWVQADALTAL